MFVLSGFLKAKVDACTDLYCSKLPFTQAVLRHNPAHNLHVKNQLDICGTVLSIFSACTLGFSYFFLMLVREYDNLMLDG